MTSVRLNLPDQGIERIVQRDHNELKIHNKDGFVGMRRAVQLVAQVLDYITLSVQEGVSTEHINQLCHTYIIKHGAIPAPLHYKGFPKSVCTSVNHVVCHGIPSPEKVLHSGDII